MAASGRGRSHRVPAAAPEVVALRPRAGAVEEPAQIILDNCAGMAEGHIDALRADGVPQGTIYLDVLARAARRLGEMWDADLCDFTQVTIGLWRLQRPMYELSPAVQDDAQRGVQIHRAMLVPVPGSQHTLGLLRVAGVLSPRRLGRVG